MQPALPEDSKTAVSAARCGSVPVPAAAFLSIMNGTHLCDPLAENRVRCVSCAQVYWSSQLSCLEAPCKAASRGDQRDLFN